MSDTFWNNFYNGLPVLILLISVLAISMSAFIITVIIVRKLNLLHKEINGRMTDLILATAKSSKAEGVKQELDRDKGI